MYVYRKVNIILVVLVAICLVFAACQHGADGPPEKDEIGDSTNFLGIIYFSGAWEGNAGTYSLDLETLETHRVSSVVAKFMQTSGISGELGLVDNDNSVYVVTLSDTPTTRRVQRDSEAFFAPNGRKYFFHKPETGELHEGYVGVAGDRLFAADGRYGAYSPDMQKVAFLNTVGLVITDPNNSTPIMANVEKLLNEGENFVLPDEGDFFPRWSPDGTQVVAVLKRVNPTNGYEGGLGIVIDTEGQLVTFLANDPVEPIWSADGKLLYYISDDIMYSWNFETEENLLISGGANDQVARLRANPAGNYVAFVRTDYTGDSGVFVWDSENDWQLEAVRRAPNGGSAVDWPREPFCPDGSNTAPWIVEVAKAIDGEPAEDLIIEPGSGATVSLTVADENCNLAGGVAIFSLGEDVWRAFDLILPAGAGCGGDPLVYNVPNRDPGEYELKLAVEDLCGTRSTVVTLPIVFNPIGDDDDDDNDDNDDNDDDDDDDNDDDDNDTTGPPLLDA